ncbi:MAG: LytTR family DNA-binding domain-containing protein [Fulvivirga sp.]|nr:LytTR family DNA-binding domain-containing protein [Fulvivirga sp.]
MDNLKILIIEDEQAAADKLIKMINAIRPAARILQVIQNTEEAITYLQSDVKPDLAFVDIQLADNNSLKIFKHVQINIPVIFTTAYDEFILEALEHNAIDYLLKPIDPSRLAKAFDKVKGLKQHFTEKSISSILVKGANEKKKRFLVKKGTDFIPVSIDDIAYFFTQHKVVFLKDHEGSTFIIDKTLTEIQNTLDSQFFRINRKYIAHIDAINKFRPSQGKIKIELTPPTTETIFVSKENAPHFRSWVEQ